MKYIPLLLLFLFAACTSDTYRIDGNCDMPHLNGETVYLKVYQGGKMQTIDSCVISEGRFTMRGHRDTIEMANLFVGEQSVCPIVLDGTEIKVGVGNQQCIGGSMLNDSLYSFIQEKNRIDSMVVQLPRHEARMVMDGMDYDEVLALLAQEQALISEMNDHLVTSFIKRNSGNVLGAGVFMIVTSAMPYPMLTPQIEEILTVASPRFKQNAYVKDFVEMAEENMLRIREGEAPLQ